GRIRVLLHDPWIVLAAQPPGRLPRDGSSLIFDPQRQVDRRRQAGATRLQRRDDRADRRPIVPRGERLEGGWPLIDARQQELMAGDVILVLLVQRNRADERQAMRLLRRERQATPQLDAGRARLDRLRRAAAL